MAVAHAKHCGDAYRGLITVRPVVVVCVSGLTCGPLFLFRGSLRGWELFASRGPADWLLGHLLRKSDFAARERRRRESTATDYNLLEAAAELLGSH